MVAKYRKKPVVIEAFRYEPDAPGMTEYVESLPDVREDFSRGGEPGYANTPHQCLYIDTLEGTHRADPGDYIITGVQGERYPCKPDIFEATYEPVEDAVSRKADQLMSEWTGE